MPVELAPASLVHVGPIASRMREADRIECRALGRSPKEALRIGLRTSLNPFTALVDGRPEAMMGVMPVSLLKGEGLVWMLGTDAVYGQGRALLRLGPKVLRVIGGGLPQLGNIVSAENRRAIRFLRYLGFHVGGPAQVHGGIAFVPFHMKQAIQAVAMAA